MTASAQIIAYAKIAQQVYNEPPQFGAANGPARARLYGNVLAFRGTDDFASIIADANIDTTPVWGLGRLHKGFWEALAGILPGLLTIQIQPAVIVGHSEGAALASLYAGVLCMMGWHSVSVYGFEPPRMCADNTLLQLFVTHSVFRFYSSNGSDPVTEVPPELSLPGELTHIGSPRGIIPDIEDHYIDNVIRSLEA